MKNDYTKLLKPLLHLYALNQVHFTLEDGIERTFNTQLLGMTRGTYNSGNLWEARICICDSQQVTIGRTNYGHKAALMRDCALVYFWKYRKRGANREPSDLDLNFGLKRVQENLCNPQVKAYLARVEGLLRAAGALPEIVVRHGEEVVFCQKVPAAVRLLGELSFCCPQLRVAYRDTVRNTLDECIKLLNSTFLQIEREVADSERDRLAVCSAQAEKHAQAIREKEAALREEKRADVDPERSAIAWEREETERRLAIARQHVKEQRALDDAECVKLGFKDFAEFKAWCGEGVELKPLDTRAGKE